LKTSELNQIIYNHFDHQKYVIFEEFRFSTGRKSKSNPKADSRFDFFIINTYPSSDFETTTLECKVSKSDFIKDISKKNKHVPALSISNNFYFIAPINIIPIHLVPDYAGLIVIDENLNWNVIKSAPFRSITKPTWNFVASLARRVNKSTQIDPENLSDAILDNLYNVLYNNNNSLPKEDILFFDIISQEYRKRKIHQFKKNIINKKFFERFVFHIVRKYPKISYELLLQFWEKINDKKIKNMKLIQKYITETLSEGA